VPRLSTYPGSVPHYRRNEKTSVISVNMTNVRDKKVLGWSRETKVGRFLIKRASLEGLSLKLLIC
jgi:hypothetical protein